MPIVLDDVLFNQRPEPYTLRALFAFLDTKCATELLDFWVTALDVRNMFEPGHPRSSYAMNKWEIQDVEKVEGAADRPPTPNLLAKRHTETQLLMRTTYIDDDSALCINISAELRNSIIDKCPKTLDDPPTPGLFDEAMEECERLIDRNYFKAFKELADHHAKNRAAHPPAPPPRPRGSRVFKGQLLTREEIAALVPKEPPPDEVS